MNKLDLTLTLSKVKYEYINEKEEQVYIIN